MDVFVETAGMVVVLAGLLVLGVVAWRLLRSRAKKGTKLRIGANSPDEDVYKYHGLIGRNEAERPKISLRHYQYLAAGKIDRLYEQIAKAGDRPITTIHELGNSSIARVSESEGPASELTTVQKLEVLRSVVGVSDIEDRFPSEAAWGSPVLVKGNMLMKHAVLPVYHGDSSPTQAVWVGRLESGRYVCLGGSAANMGADVPRGQYINSGVTAVLQAIRTAADEVEVLYTPDVSHLSIAEKTPEPLHRFPGAWDAEVVDVWAHYRKLNAHRVAFLAYVMTSSRIDIGNPRYDVVVGSPLSIEFN
jgi:hypothetical protein